jgi:hypothetical protein
MIFGSGSSSGQNFSVSGLVKVIAAATIIAIFAADALATLAKRGGLPHVSLEWPNPADKTKARNRPEVVTTYRAVGIDGVTTSAIPKVKPADAGLRRDAAVLSPCSEIEP